VNDSPTAIIANHIASVPVDLEALIRALGIKFERDYGLPSDIAGKLMRDPAASSGFRIVINARDNPKRQRFTMAHEVAHFVLHRDLLENGLVDDALYRSSLSDEYERQANRFAAQILLPASAVRQAYQTNKALGSLAQAFNVSDAALRIRLSELGLAA
jgi:Zn-dependent peptidase ImmA (M78 family)